MRRRELRTERVDVRRGRRHHFHHLLGAIANGARMEHHRLVAEERFRAAGNRAEVSRTE